jgi:ATP-dependent helicase/DNAse subunit B
MPVRAEATIVLRKREADLTAVRALLEKGLSPSSLGDWLRCPLDFHFKKVLRLKESGEIGARIADNVTGSALHATMEAIYRTLLGKPLEEALLSAAAENIEELLLAELAGVGVGAAMMRSGQPLLQLRMAIHAARRFLRNEAKAVKSGAVITVLDLELDLSCKLSLAEERIGSPVRILGRLDRVDRSNGRTRILDLKTGKVDPAQLNVRELSLDGLKGEKRYAAQLLTYAWLYLTEHPGLDAVEAGVLPLQRAASHEPLLLKIGGETHVQRTMLPAIGKVLSEAVAEMMDPNVPVTHDPKSKYCRFCLKEGN